MSKVSGNPPDCIWSSIIPSREKRPNRVNSFIRSRASGLTEDSASWRHVTDPPDFGVPAMISVSAKSICKLASEPRTTASL